MKTMIKISRLLLMASLQTLSLNATDYSYGYDGMEKDDDIKGVGNGYTVSASSITQPSGLIIKNDWGFRTSQSGIVFRRYIGK